MASLLRHHPAITHEEAESYVHQTGPWSRFLLTPWPLKSLAEGVVVLAVGVWAGIALALHHPWAGVGVLALTFLTALLVAAPGAYTESHQEFASRYFAAVRLHGDEEVGAHPYLVLAVSPLVCALAGALGGVHQESLSVRLLGAAAGAVFGLVYALVRIGRARRAPLP